MNIQPKVSIVIPVYQGENYLSEAIDSALAQTYQNIEILVINDGSDDEGKTEKVANRYGDKIRYFFKPNGGVASTLNLGIKEMSGEYFSWLSHDDLYHPDKVKKNIEAINKIGRKNSIIYSDYAVFSTDPNTAIPVSMKGVPPEQFRYWITVENCLHGCTLLIPRTAFEQVGYFNESLRTTQDYDLWFRLAKVYQFIHLPECLVKARSHTEQGSCKMADIVLTECDTLLTGFVSDLTLKELVTATKSTDAIAYQQIASSMWNRGFQQAGLTANKLAKQYRVFNIPFLISTVKLLIKKIMPYSMIKFARIFFNFLSRLTINHPLLKKKLSRKISEKNLREKFSEVYEKNIFGGKISRSGEGSDLVQTTIIRRELPKIIKNFNIKTFLDAPCGDWYWMKETDLGVTQYIGVDIVDSLIEKNQAVFGSPTVTFQSLNLVKDKLPKADLIFSRDCLVHLTFSDAFKIIDNFKRSGAKYLLTTTFPQRNSNQDLMGKDSFWRTLNMQIAPFYFPDPILLVNEGCTEELEQYADKSLGLWLLDNIKIAI